MVTDTEALRAQFEKSISDAATFKVVREGYGYTDRACGWAWEGYQAGHAQLDHLREAAKEAAEHLRNEAAELKKAHTVAGELDGTEPDAMAECERLIALANRLQANAGVQPAP